VTAAPSTNGHATHTGNGVAAAPSGHYCRVPNDLFTYASDKTASDGSSLPGVGANGIAVYTALCKCADNVSKRCYPSFLTLAEMTGLSRRTVIEVIQDLERWKLIAVKRSKDGKSPNVYTLLPCSPCTSANPALVQKTTGTSAESAPPLVQDLHPTSAGIAPELDPLNLTQLNLTHEQDPPNPPKGGTRSEAGKKRTRSSAKGADHPGFDAFWLAWPQERRVAKLAAQRAWNNLAPDEALRSEILSKVEAQKKPGGILAREPEYIPHPASWLNGKRWNDEQQQPRSGAERNGTTNRTQYRCAE
jgi:hypothetical protein